MVVHRAVNLSLIQTFKVHPVATGLALLLVGTMAFLVGIGVLR